MQAAVGNLKKVTLELGGVALDLVRRTADVGSGPVSLSEREFLLTVPLSVRGRPNLAALMANPSFSAALSQSGIASRASSS